MDDNEFLSELKNIERDVFELKTGYKVGQQMKVFVYNYNYTVTGSVFGQYDYQITFDSSYNQPIFCQCLDDRVYMLEPNSNKIRFYTTLPASKKITFISTRPITEVKQIGGAS